MHEGFVIALTRTDGTPPKLAKCFGTSESNPVVYLICEDAVEAAQKLSEELQLPVSVFRVGLTVDNEIAHFAGR